eukprot:1131530-Pyramimonas_sp.AAC.1
MCSGWCNRRLGKISTGSDTGSRDRRGHRLSSYYEAISPLENLNSPPMFRGCTACPFMSSPT